MARRKPDLAAFAESMPQQGAFSAPAVETHEEHAHAHAERHSRLMPGDLCPHCHYSALEAVRSFAGPDCEFFVKCPSCNALICTYVPMPHQAEFHRDQAKVKMYAGGYGSAKTYTCGMEFLAHALQVPKGALLMGASTWGQVSDTCLKFVTENLPKELVASASQDKVNWNLLLRNGSRISAKPFNEEGKLRSMNLSCVWIEEASEVDYEVFVQLQTRLRNANGVVNGVSRLRMLLSTNPDVGWIAKKVLAHAAKITAHGDVVEDYSVDPRAANPDFSVHIAATSANVHLPKGYEAGLAAGKPRWWVDRYLHGSFRYSEGLVYPMFSDWFEEPFAIPRAWPRVTGTDFGRNDPTAHLAAAVDPNTGIIHVYGEVLESLGDKPVAWIVDEIKRCDACDAMTPRLYPNSADPRGRAKDQVSALTWFDEYQRHGYPVIAAPGCSGPNTIAPTIQKVSDYGAAGKLRIFATCVRTRDALAGYAYKRREMGKDDAMGETPDGKNDHLPDALRYLVAPFPGDPASGAYVLAVAEAVRRAYSAFSAKNDAYEDDYVMDMTENFG